MDPLAFTRTSEYKLPKSDRFVLVHAVSGGSMIETCGRFDSIEALEKAVAIIKDYDYTTFCNRTFYIEDTNIMSASSNGIDYVGIIKNGKIFYRREVLVDV